MQSSEASSLLECTSGRTVVALALMSVQHLLSQRTVLLERPSRRAWQGPLAKRNMGLSLDSQEDSRARAENRAQNGLE